MLRGDSPAEPARQAVRRSPIDAPAGSAEPTPADVVVHEPKALPESNRRERLCRPRVGMRFWLGRARFGQRAPVDAPVTPVERVVFRGRVLLSRGSGSVRALRECGCMVASSKPPRPL